MKQFSIYEFERNGIVSICQFIAADRLPDDLPISTPFTFPFLEEKVVLALDKNDWWNPLGGHIEASETWLDTTVREAEEEAGVVVEQLVLVGYIKIQKKGKLNRSKYPPVSVLPITYSQVNRVINPWLPMETKQRRLFSRVEAEAVLTAREDNAQMLDIYHYVLQQRAERKISYQMSYRPGELLIGVPVTQVYVFCRDKSGNICVVRDSGESHYSLPGGGVELGELPETAAGRELMEEAQISGGSMILLGTNEVVYRADDRLVERIQQVRYFCSAADVPEFTKNYHGFETEERLFVTLDQLPKYITWLTEPGAHELLRQVTAQL